MDFLVTTCYCGKREEDEHIYGGFHISELGTTFSGYDESEVVKVELSVIDHAENYEVEDTEPGVYFGIYHFNEGCASFIFPNIYQTKICSPDFFKNSIESEEAVFVKLIVKEV